MDLAPDRLTAIHNLNLILILILTTLRLENTHLSKCPQEK